MTVTNSSEIGQAEAALELVHLSKRFAGIRALDDVSFRVRPGHIHGLVGENGAGKSTLLKIVDGYYPFGSYEGQVRMAGREVELRSPLDARRSGLALVPQETSVFDTLTVAENLCIESTGRRAFVSEAAMRQQAEKFLEDMELPLNAHATVSSLSASQKQLVMIGRALYAKPTFLILDEPTAALTSHEADRLFKIVQTRCAAGMTVMFVSHRLDEVIEVCDRVTVLRDGRLADELEKSEFSAARIIRAMIGRDLGEMYPPRADTRPDHDEVLRAEHVSVAASGGRSVAVVDDVSLTLHRGEILGIGGLVGSGRSELVHALSGRTPMSSGRIWLESREVGPFSSPLDAQRHGIGLVTEDRKRDGLLFNLNVRENVTLSYLRHLGRILIGKTLEAETAQSMVERLRIVTRSTETPVVVLSGGNQQKVVLARALLTRPKVLFLDEPTVGVDVGAKAEIYLVLRELVAEGMSIVVVSSDAAELFGLCDRVIVLRQGKVHQEHDVATVSHEQLVAAFTGVEMEPGDETGATV